MNSKVFDELSRIHGLNKLNYTFNFSLKNRYLYVENPKVASSSIKYALMVNELVGSGISAQGRRPHASIVNSVFVKPYQVSAEKFSEYTEHDSNFFKFSIVRNPYYRALSGYLDKVVRNKSPKASILKILGFDSNELEREISFSQFLEAILKTKSMKELNPHWRPQTEQLGVDYISYDFIGRFEQLRNFWDVLVEKISLPPSVIDEFSPKNTTRSSTQLKHYYTAENVESVKAIYKRDFENFGYSLDLNIDQT